MSIRRSFSGNIFRVSSLSYPPRHNVRLPRRSFISVSRSSLLWTLQEPSRLSITFTKKGLIPIRSPKAARSLSYSVPQSSIFKEESMAERKCRAWISCLLGLDIVFTNEGFTVVEEINSQMTSHPEGEMERGSASRWWSAPMIRHILLLYKCIVVQRTLPIIFLLDDKDFGSVDHSAIKCMILPSVHDVAIAALQNGYEKLSFNWKPWSPACRCSPFSGSHAVLEAVMTDLRNCFHREFLRDISHRDISSSISRQIIEDLDLIFLTLSGKFHQGKETDRRELQRYMNTQRHTKLTLSLAASLLSLSCLSMLNLRIIVLRSINDHIYASKASTNAVANLFSVLAQALLSNDLYFNSPNAPSESFSIDEAWTTNSSAQSIHDLMINELIVPIPHWIEASPDAQRYYRSTAYRKGDAVIIPVQCLQAPRSISSARRDLLRTFSRYVRWTPLLRRISRVYTRSQLGIQLIELELCLRRALPEVESCWPCSFYVGVIGAALDAYKEDGEDGEGWKTITGVAERALCLLGSNSPHDLHKIWLILCKAALTLPPLSNSCERLLEAYHIAGAALLGEERGGLAHCLKVDLTALQQITRLVRGTMAKRISTEEKCNTRLEDQIKRIFSLLNHFLIDYSPGATSIHGEDSASWWWQWWTRQGGYILSDLWECCGIKAKGIAFSFIQALIISTFRQGERLSNDIRRDQNTLETTNEVNQASSFNSNDVTLLKRLCQQSVWDRILHDFGFVSEEKESIESKYSDCLGYAGVASDVQVQAPSQHRFIWQCPTCRTHHEEDFSVLLSCDSLNKMTCDCCLHEIQKEGIAHGRRSKVDDCRIYCMCKPWKCGCGAVNDSQLELFCKACSSHKKQGDEQPPLNFCCYTCPHCKELIGSTFRYISSGVGKNIAVPGQNCMTLPFTMIHRFTFMIHFCPLCGFPHPRDHSFLKHRLLIPAQSSPLQSTQFENGCPQVGPPCIPHPIERHCLLCGTPVLPTILKAQNSKNFTECDEYTILFHCGTFQTIDENALFYCDCATSCGKEKRTEPDHCTVVKHPYRGSSQVEELNSSQEWNSMSQNRYSIDGWHVGYHCDLCLRPRTELRRKWNEDHKTNSYYLWQCTREHSPHKGRDTEGLNSSNSYTPPCRRWNYSWSSKCGHCGGGRIKSVNEPRAPSWMADDLIVHRASEVEVPQSLAGMVYQKHLCKNCGIPHLQYHCPFYEQDEEKFIFSNL